MGLLNFYEEFGLRDIHTVSVRVRTHMRVRTHLNALSDNMMFSQNHTSPFSDCKYAENKLFGKCGVRLWTTCDRQASEQ
jgi:hypothetical protein